MSEQWDVEWDIQGTVHYLLNRKCRRVALQFPDVLLNTSAAVAAELRRRLNRTVPEAQVFILADTSYNSLAVDEVAALHASADCVVHYGRASLSPLSRLPAYYVFGRQPLDTAACAERIAQYAASPEMLGKPALLVLPDQPYAHAVPELRRYISQVQREGNLPVVLAEVSAHCQEPSAPAACSGSHATGCCTTTAAVDASPSQGAASACCAAGAGGATAQMQAQACSCSSDISRNSPNGAGVGAAVSHPAEPTTADGQQQALPSHHRQQAGSTCSCSSSSSTEQQRPPLQEEAPPAGTSGRGAESAAGLTWRLPSGMVTGDCALLWLGPPDVPALMLLHLEHADCHWAAYDPAASSWQKEIPREVGVTLRRRYYLVERAKNASIVGILVGTLGVAGYLDAIENIRRLAHRAGKKTYTMLMGKPNPAKLANFPEVEVFVMVADPQGLILDCREYYAPIITAYEAQLAFAPGGEWTGQYRLDFAPLQGMSNASVSEHHRQPRFSLVDGQYHGGDSSGEDEEGPNSRALTAPAMKALTLSEAAKEVMVPQSAAEFLSVKRTYTGLEAPFVGAPFKAAAKAVPGRSGRAARYSDEPLS